MRSRSVLAIILVSILCVSACGDGGAVGSSSQPATDSPTTLPVGTTGAPVAPSTSVPTSAPATPPSSTSTTASDTAADALAGFFQSVAELDTEIRAAADLFNASYDEVAATVSGSASSAIDALDAALVVSQISAGLSPELETAVLGVLSDLQSRVASLQGATRMLSDDPSMIAFMLDCLTNGADSVARFAADVESAIAMAALEPAPTAAPDSIPAGILAVRVEAIRSMNFGCDSCGGLAYTQPFPVDWEGRTVLDGVGFEASFDGVGWQILIYAC